MQDNFWNNKKVLITGHTGFKGSWLSLYLHHLGAEVTGLSLDENPQQSLFHILGMRDCIESVKGDIRDLSLLQEVMSRVSPDVVFHLAAQSLVRDSYLNPVETYSTNVMGTVQVLEAVRHVDSVRSVIIVTSDKCYDNKEWVWGYRENDAMGGYDPYSSSKGCAELVTSAYRSSYFSEDSKTLIASVRAGNVIGGGDWAKDRLIPDAVRAFSNNERVIIRNPDAVRPWQHVLEPLGGYMKLAQLLYESKREFAQGWNFGPADEDIRPVSWVMDQLVGLWNDGAGWSLDDGKQLHEAKLLVLDNSLSRFKLGWRPQLSLNQALEWVVEWYKAYYDKGDVLQVSLEQIKRYIKGGRMNL